ncbi:hypothetical protein Tco_0566732 [Tanacetum coccineum]
MRHLSLLHGCNLADHTYGTETNLDTQFPRLSNAYGCPTLSSLAEKLRVVEQQMDEGKVMLIGEDGKLLKPIRITYEVPSSQENASLKEQHVSINSSFNKVVNDDTSTSKVNFRLLETNDTLNDTDLIIPRSPVEEVNNICTHMLLDSYMNTMCEESWGKNSYAYVLIELNAENDFKDHLVVVIPLLEEPSYTRMTIRVEYRWTPPRCSSCCDHQHGKKMAFRMKSKLEYRHVSTRGGSTSKSHDNEASKKVNHASTSGTSKYPTMVNNKVVDPVLCNSFDMLNMVNNDDDDDVDISSGYGTKTRKSWF